MSNMWKNSLKFTVFLALGVFLIWWSMRQLTAEQVQQIIEALKHAKYGFVILALVFGVYSFVTRALRWRMQLQSMGYSPTCRNILMAVMTGYLANLAFPRLGEFLRSGVLDRYEKIPIAKSLGTTITERVLDSICFVILLVLALVFQFEVLKDYAMTNFSALYDKFTNPVFLRTIGIIVTVIIILITVFMVVLRKRIAHTKLYIRLKNIVISLWEGLISLRYLKNVGLFCLHTVVLWICYFLMSYLAFFAMPETAQLPIGAGLSMLVFGTVAVIVTPGGIGLYPIVCAQIFALYGVDWAIGFAMGWLIWGTQNIIILIGGLLSIVLLPLVNNQDVIKNNEH